MLTTLRKITKSKKNNDFIPKNEDEKQVIKTMIKYNFEKVYDMYKDNENLLIIFLFKLFQTAKISFHYAPTIITENSVIPEEYEFKFYENDSNYLSFKDKDIVINFLKKMYKSNTEKFLKFLNENTKIHETTTEYINKVLKLSPDTSGDNIFNIYKSKLLTEYDLWEKLNQELLEYDSDNINDLNEWIRKADDFLYNKYLEQKPSIHNLNKQLLSIFKKDYAKNVKILLCFLLFNETKFTYFLLMDTLEIDFLLYILIGLNSIYTRLFLEQFNENYQFEIISKILNFIFSKKMFLEEQIIKLLQDVIEFDIDDEIQAIILAYTCINFYNIEDKEKMALKIKIIVDLILDTNKKQIVTLFRKILDIHPLYDEVEKNLLDILKKSRETRLRILQKGLFFDLIRNETMEKIKNDDTINKDLNDISSVSNQLLIYQKKFKSKHLDTLAITMNIQNLELLEYKVE